MSENQNDSQNGSQNEQPKEQPADSKQKPQLHPYLVSLNDRRNSALLVKQFVDEKLLAVKEGGKNPLTNGDHAEIKLHMLRQQALTNLLLSDLAEASFVSRWEIEKLRAEKKAEAGRLIAHPGRMS